MHTHSIDMLSRSDELRASLQAVLAPLGWSVRVHAHAEDVLAALAGNATDCVVVDAHESEGAVLARMLLHGGNSTPCVLVDEADSYLARHARHLDSWAVLGQHELARIGDAVVRMLLSWLQRPPPELLAPMPPAPRMLDSEFRATVEDALTADPVLTAELRFAALSQRYAADTMLLANKHMGERLFDVFPDNPDDPSADGARNLAASLERAKASGRADLMALQRYDVREAAGAGGFVEKWWFPVNHAIVGGGEVRYLLHRVKDVTRFVLLKRRLESPALAV